MVEVKEFPKLQVAYIHTMGPYEQSGAVLNRLFQWAASRGIRPVGPPLGIFYDDPAKTPAERCRSDICLPVDLGTAGEDKIEIKTIPSTIVAFALHKGPYGQYDQTYLQLYAWIQGNGYRPAGPPMEIYLSDPGRTAEKDLLTEICVPLARIAGHGIQQEEART